MASGTPSPYRCHLKNTLVFRDAESCTQRCARPPRNMGFLKSYINNEINCCSTMGALRLSLSSALLPPFSLSRLYPTDYDFRFCAGADQELFGAFLAMRDVPAGLEIRRALAQAHGAVAGVGGSPEGFLPLMKTLLPNMESGMLRSVMACSS